MLFLVLADPWARRHVAGVPIGARLRELGGVVSEGGSLPSQRRGGGCYRWSGQSWKAASIVSRTGSGRFWDLGPCPIPLLAFLGSSFCTHLGSLWISAEH